MMQSRSPVSELPLVTADEREEIRRAIVQIEAAKAPAQRDEISRMVGKLAVLFPSAKISDAEARAQNLMYAELLGDIPAHALRLAFRRAAQECRFFPAVAEIRERALPAMAVESWRHMRLHMMATNYDHDQQQSLRA